MGLDELREEIGRVDRELLELVAKRQALAAEIGQTKRAQGLPTRDFRRERVVLDAARQRAASLGLPAGLAEDLLLRMIRSAVTRQEQDQLVARGAGDGRRVLVIGGAGKMGRWFVDFLGSQGFQVEVADPAGRVEGLPWRADWRAAELDQDLIVVAAQLRTSGEILHELAASPPKGVVFDVGSLKSPLRAGLRALVEAGGRVGSLHPMFGPDTELLSGRHVVVVDVGCPEANDALRGLFDSTSAHVVEMDLESHDRVIAYVLGLSHALNIAFATALAESGESAPDLARISSTTFDAQLGVSSRVLAENPHLYFEIQSLNDYGTESLSALLLAVERLRSVVRAGDEAGFVSLMSRGHDYLARRSSG